MTRSPARCIVIGAGLAGAAAAASFARRGWRVRVLDRAGAPAAGASGLPVGLLAPHTSLDDNLLSRLSRAGVERTMLTAGDLLVEGRDWQPGDSFELRKAGDPLRLRQGPGLESWQVAATMEDGRPAIRHPRSAWIRPAALVHAWLATPGVQWEGEAEVARIIRADPWQVETRDGRRLDAELVVVAAALDSAALAGGRMRLTPVRGQVTWGEHTGGLDAPSFPVNGDGHFIPNVPHEGRRAWFCGSTYGRGDTDTSVRAEDTAANLARLASLLPKVAASIDRAAVRAWAGIRCASHDRRPLVGEIEPGLLVSTAMGSRGLTFAALAAELLAARVQGEPLPVEAQLARALDVNR